MFILRVPKRGFSFSEKNIQCFITSHLILWVPMYVISLSLSLSLYHSKSYHHLYSAYAKAWILRIKYIMLHQVNLYFACAKSPILCLSHVHTQTRVFLLQLFVDQKIISYIYTAIVRLINSVTSVTGPQVKQSLIWKKIYIHIIAKSRNTKPKDRTCSESIVVHITMYTLYPKTCDKSKLHPCTH